MFQILRKIAFTGEFALGGCGCGAGVVAPGPRSEGDAGWKGWSQRVEAPTFLTFPRMDVKMLKIPKP